MFVSFLISGMNYQNILITGGTSGLGFELAKICCSHKYNVWITGRSLKKGLPEGMKIHFLRIDFSDLNQTRRVIKEIIDQGIRFDIIVNNAGVLGPVSFCRTVDGFEYTFQVNFLTHLLIDDMIISASEPGHPVKLAVVTSPIYRFVSPDFKMPDEATYEPYTVYALSKYYLLLSADYLKKKHIDKDIRLINFNPGVFRSGIYRVKQKWFQVLYKIAAPFMRSPALVALKLFELLESNSVSEGIIYRSRYSKGKQGPVLTTEAEDFLLACEQAVKIMR